MIVPRFSANHVVNNVSITLVVCLGALLALAVAFVLFVWLLRRTTQATHLPLLETAGEKLRGPLRGLAMLLSVGVILACCAGLAVSVYSDVDLQLWVDRVAVQVTWRHVEAAGTAAAIVAALAVLSFWLRRALRPLLPHVEKRLLAIGAFEAEVVAVQGFVGQLVPLLNVGVVYITLRLGTVWLDVPAQLAWLALTTAYIVLVLNITRTAVFLVQMSTEALDRIGRTHAEKAPWAPYYTGVRGLWPLARRTFEAIAWISAGTLCVREFESLEGFVPYGPRIIRLIAIYFVARVVVELSRVLVAESFCRHVDPRDEVAKRRATLTYLVQSLAKYLIYFGAVVLGMSELGIDPAPFLAGAGIVGLTVGLGAQKLVADMVSGFFILFEGQLLTGDYVQIGDDEGVVEAVHLRTTEIRDSAGRLHALRNGNIERIINYSRGYVCAVVDIGVAYDSDFDRVYRAAELAGLRLCEELGEMILEPTTVAGVEGYSDNDVIVRTVTKVQPGTHNTVARRFRRVLLETFTAEQVDVPFAQIVVRMAGGEPPKSPLVAKRPG